MKINFYLKVYFWEADITAQSDNEIIFAEVKGKLLTLSGNLDAINKSIVHFQ